MAQYVNSNVPDKGLEWVKANVTRLVACTSLPDNYADVANKIVGFVAATSDDFTIEDGDTEPADFDVIAPAGLRSRKITHTTLVGQVTREGETQATVTAWVDDVNELVVKAGPATPQTLVFQNPLTFLPTKIEIMPMVPVE